MQDWIVDSMDTLALARFPCRLASMSVPHLEALDRAIELLGGPVATARRLNLSGYQVVQQWRRSGVPPIHCVALERETGGAVTRPQLRPDDFARIWPELAAQEA